MMEEQIDLLTKKKNKESPGKIIYSALFLLCSIEMMKKGAGLSGKGKRKVDDDSEVITPAAKRVKTAEPD